MLRLERLLTYTVREAKERKMDAEEQELTRYGLTILAIDVTKEDEVTMTKEQIQKTLQQVRFARVGRTYSKELAKIEIGTVMHEESLKAWKIMKKVLEAAHKIEWRYGVPPRGPHERKIGELMTAMGLTTEMEEW